MFRDFRPGHVMGLASVIGVTLIGMMAFYAASVPSGMPSREQVTAKCISEGMNRLSGPRSEDHQRIAKACESALVRAVDINE